MIAKYVALERRRTLILKVNQLPFNEEIISLKIQETMFSTIEARETLQDGPWKIDLPVIPGFD